jgi:DNA modification methylase
MKTIISFRNEQKLQLPSEFQNDDVRYPEEMVEYFLTQFTAPGDVVLDPFMGYGTTLRVAERMNRLGYGIEYDERRCRYVQATLHHPERALRGDSTKLNQIELPPADFSITSPPYMGQHHTENPFTSYTTEEGGYNQYLSDIGNIYAQLNGKLKPGARAVVEVSNLKHEDGPLTMLAWDIAREIVKVMNFEGEVVIAWDGGYGYGYDHSYALIFSRR